MDFNLSIYHYCVGRFSCCRKYYNIHETCCQQKRNVKSVCHGYVLHPHKSNPYIYNVNNLQSSILSVDLYSINNVHNEQKYSQIIRRFRMRYMTIHNYIQDRK